MSDEQSVADKLAVVRTVAFPYGLSDRTAGGFQITTFGEHGPSHWKGNVNEFGVECIRCWYVADGMNLHRRDLDLVPLPAPPPETPEKPDRLSQDHLLRLAAFPWTVMANVLSTDVNSMAREILDRRRRFSCDQEGLKKAETAAASLKAEVDRLTRDLDEWRELSQQKAFAELLGERNAAVSRLRGVESDRAVAIQIGRCLRDNLESIDTKIKWAVVSAFDERYGESLPIAGRDFVACESQASVLREFPFDRPGWFFQRSWYTGNVARINAASETITVDGVQFVEVGGTWTKVSDMRQWQRSASPAGPWEPCPKGGA